MLQTDVANALNEIADMHDVLGDRFRPRVYRRAARSIENSSADLLKLMEISHYLGKAKSKIGYNFNITCFQLVSP